MEPYSVVADALSKYQLSPEWIKALWLASVSLTVVGVAAVIGGVLREALRALPRRGEPRGVLVCGLYRSPDGRWLLFERGTVREIDGAALAELKWLPALTPPR